MTMPTRDARRLIDLMSDNGTVYPDELTAKIRRWRAIFEAGT